MAKQELKPLGRIRFERLLRGWPQVYVAATLGIDQHTISNIERGQVPTTTQLAKLAALYDTTPDALMTAGVAVVPSEFEVRDDTTPTEPELVTR